MAGERVPGAFTGTRPQTARGQNAVSHRGTELGVTSVTVRVTAKFVRFCAGSDAPHMSSYEQLLQGFG
jgi:hypothetical protein